MAEVKRTNASSQPQRQFSTSGAGTGFKGELKNKTESELKGMLKDQALSEAQRKSVTEELAQRKLKVMKEEAEALESSGEGGGGGGVGSEASDLEELLMMMMQGLLGPQGLRKLAAMLGVNPQDLAGNSASAPKSLSGQGQQQPTFAMESADIR